MEMTRNPNTLPGKFIILGMLGLIGYLAFIAYVVVSVWESHGALAALVVAVSIGVPVKLFLAPRVLTFFQGKKSSKGVS